MTGATSSGLSHEFILSAVISKLKHTCRPLLQKGFALRHGGIKIITAAEPASAISGFQSQKGQDKFIYREFGDALKRTTFPKLFLDIGCNHPTKFSNSYFFEAQLDFRCIAVDPLTSHREAWGELRPLSKLYSVALADKPGQMTLIMGQNANGHDDMFSRLVREDHKVVEENRTTRRVEVETAQNILRRSAIREVGIMSLDVEGFELDVLRGIDFEETTIHLALIENARGHFGSRQLRDFMRSNGFRFYARFWGLDDLFVNTRVGL